MDFLSNLNKNDEHKPTSDNHNPNNSDANLKPTKSDLIHSAKVVVEAAKSHARLEPEKYDKAELAGASADLLNAAAEYGKLDDNKGLGKYVDKAEDYLRHYNTSHPADHSAKPADHKPTQSEHHGGAAGGSGDFMKMAGDFLKK